MTSSINVFSVLPKNAARRYLPALALLAGLNGPAQAQTVTQNTPFPLGVHSSNPNGNDASEEHNFEANTDQFLQIMKGAHLTHFNAFTDFSDDPSTWVSNASWTAWSNAKSGAKYFGSTTGIIPVVGVPLASNGGGWGNVDTFYQDIIAGKYDAVYTGIVKAWADQGYKTVEFRNAYEFNGTFMPWSPLNSGAANVNLHFVQAFQRVADLEHTAGKQYGITAKVNWNPNATNWMACDPQTLYPGDSYVDIISVDQYSPAWPLDYTDWAHGTTTQLSPADWVANPLNRRHYWTWPGDTQWKSPKGNTPDLGDWSWSLRMTVKFALQHGKPIALDETGAGPAQSNGALNTDPKVAQLLDEPEFPHWLSDELKLAQSQGVVVDHVNIWCGTEADGDWNFVNNTNRPKPLEATAWATYFGAGTTTTTTTTPTPTPTPTATISNGTYKLLARHSGQALDVSGNSVANGASIIQWPWSGDANQQWVVELQSDGTYTLTHQGTSERLDVKDNSAADGGTVRQWAVSTTDAQRWSILPTDNGYYKLIHKGTTKCLDVDGGPGATAKGTKVHQWEYAGGLNQQWQLVRLDNTAATAKTASVSPAAASSAAPLVSDVAASLSAYPNPSHGQATLSFTAAQAQYATVYVYDAQANLVTLLTVPVQAGHTDFALPGSLPQGIYFVRATFDGRKQHFTLKVE